MNRFPPAVAELAAALNSAPGIGPRSAEKIALWLVLSSHDNARRWSDTIERATKEIRACEECGALREPSSCEYCDDASRDDSLIVLVERPQDVFLLERSRAFNGRYHVLGGRLSPVNGVDESDLNLTSLEKRLGSGTVSELILALSSDVEGEATAHYLAERFQSDQLRVTRLAQGLPAGAGLEYADELTVGQAFRNRAPALGDPL